MGVLSIFGYQKKVVSLHLVVRTCQKGWLLLCPSFFLFLSIHSTDVSRFGNRCEGKILVVGKKFFGGLDTSLDLPQIYFVICNKSI